MKSLIYIPLLAATAFITGCSTSTRVPEYECALDTISEGKCASMERAYNASKGAVGLGDNKVQSVFDPRAKQESGEKQPFFKGQPSNYPEPSQNGLPVFQQPKVMRVWVAPYVDADGNLRSGEYSYFSTPGSWNYGGMRKPGAAAGIFGPSRPDSLGFKPIAEASDAKASTSRNAPALPASSAKAPEGAAGSTSNITQPYQRANDK